MVEPGNYISDAAYLVPRDYQALFGMKDIHIRSIESTTRVWYYMYSYTQMLLQY